MTGVRERRGSPSGVNPQNCPFYGHELFVNTFLPLRILLGDSGGNQCALVTDSHSPCIIETIDWRECPRVRNVRVKTAAGI